MVGDFDYSLVLDQVSSYKVRFGPQYLVTFKNEKGVLIKLIMFFEEVTNINRVIKTIETNYPTFELLEIEEKEVNEV